MVDDIENWPDIVEYWKARFKNLENENKRLRCSLVFAYEKLNIADFKGTEIPVLEIKENIEEVLLTT